MKRVKNPGYKYCVYAKNERLTLPEIHFSKKIALFLLSLSTPFEIGFLAAIWKLLPEDDIEISLAIISTRVRYKDHLIQKENNE